VEDEPLVADLIKRLLEDLGNSCLVAPDTDHADRVLEQSAVDAVTLDLGVPGRGGLEWLERVATCRPELARRTLIITGLELEPATVVQVARCGAGLLAKPFSLLDLQEAVRTQLDRPSDPTPRLD
jgi:two-component system KDP operon response regulator KdpE